MQGFPFFVTTFNLHISWYKHKEGLLNLASKSICFECIQRSAHKNKSETNKKATTKLNMKLSYLSAVLAMALSVNGVAATTVSELLHLCFVCAATPGHTSLRLPVFRVRLLVCSIVNLIHERTT